MRSLLTIAHLTLHEARRRRIVLAAFGCGLAFLVLYGVGFHFIARDLERHTGVALVERRMILNFFVLAGLYATNFLTVIAAVLIPVDTMSGEIGSGVMQTLAAKPIRRSEILLGKWLAAGLQVACYLLFLAGGVLAIARVRGGFLPPDIPVGLSLMLLEAFILVTLSIGGGTRMSTVTNGITVFGLYGLAFIGSWVEQIGTLASNESARTIGTVASLIMPTEALWQLAAHHMQPDLMRDLHMTPFSPASVPTLAMVWWAAAYMIAVLVIGMRWFSRRAL